MVRVLFAVALVFLTSCRTFTGPAAGFGHVLGQRPVRDATFRGGGKEIDVALLAQVPRVVRADATVDDRNVVFRFHLASELPGMHPFYDPRTPGGWQFQLFLDTDLNPRTGYAGFEVLTRDSEPSLAPGMLVLRHTQGGGGPGGWGEAIGELRAHVSPHLITLRVPLQWIPGDGMLGYGLELYATVAGGPSGNDPVAEYGRCYTGTTRRHGHGSPLVAVSDGRSDGGTLLR